MPFFNHSIEREFSLAQLASYLQKHPDSAHNLALNHYEDYMNLADEYKQLQAEFEKLQQENIRLKSKCSDRSPLSSLPSLVNSNRGNS